MDKEMLTTSEAAQFLSIAEGTLCNMRCRGEGPSYVKINRMIRYRRVDLLKYVTVNVLNPEGENEEHVTLLAGEKNNEADSRKRLP